jgi:hypothetical protein
MILEIADHLPVRAIISLKLVHPRLNATIPRAFFQKRFRSDCERRIIHDLLSRSTPDPSRRRCVVCKDFLDAVQFSWSHSPYYLSTKRTGNGHGINIIELPRNFCMLHIARLTKIVPTKPGGRNEWVSRMDKLCLHCGSIMGWENCISACHTCDICEVIGVRTYTRYLNNDLKYTRFQFGRDAANKGDIAAQDPLLGRLFVRETYNCGKLSIHLFEIMLSWSWRGSIAVHHLHLDRFHCTFAHA